MPPAPAAPGGYLTLDQPSLFWRAWDIVQHDRTLARIARAGWRRFTVETADGREEARFSGAKLLLGALAAAPAPGGARLDAWRLSYRSREVEYPTLADHDGPLALFGDAKSSGFSAQAQVWAADRFLVLGPPAVRALAACVLVLRERPGGFR